MRKWTEEVFQQFLKQITQPKIGETRQIPNNNNGNNHDGSDCKNDDVRDNPFQNFVQKQYRKYAINDINDLLFELDWHIKNSEEKVKMIIKASNEVPLIMLQNAFNKLEISSKLDEEKLRLEVNQDNLIKLMQSGIDERIKRRMMFEIGKLGVLSRDYLK